MLRRLAQTALLLFAFSLFAYAWHCDAAWCERHVFLPQQFFLVADPRIATGARIAAAAVGVVALALVPLVPHGRRLRAFVIAVVCAVPATEVVLQWKARRLLRTDLVAAMDALTSVDPRYGVTLKPSMDRTQVMSGRPVRFVTDAERRRISGMPVDPRLPSLVFAGESTVAGHGLAWDETFPALVGARLSLQVVNVASMNYRLDQSYLRLADELPRLDRPVAAVGFFLPGLLGREFAGGGHPVARPRETTSSVPIGFEIVPPAQPSFWQRTGFYRIFRHLYWSDAQLADGLASLSAVLRAMNRASHDRGIPMVFVVTGHTPSWMLDELFVKNRLDYVVVEIPRDELLADGHPNQQGSRHIADALAERLQHTLH